MPCCATETYYKQLAIKKGAAKRRKPAANDVGFSMGEYQACMG